MHHPAQAWLGRVENAPEDYWAFDETVCTCNPGVHWTRSPGHSDYINWLLCQLVDSSAREPMTDVPSCEKPQGPAWRERTEDLRMGIPTAIALRNGERTELKHLSRCRKRKQSAIS